VIVCGTGGMVVMGWWLMDRFQVVFGFVCVCVYLDGGGVVGLSRRLDRQKEEKGARKKEGTGGREKRQED
jgi:hypothetical protein